KQSYVLSVKFELDGNDVDNPLVLSTMRMYIPLAYYMQYPEKNKEGADNNDLIWGPEGKKIIAALDQPKDGRFSIYKFAAREVRDDLWRAGCLLEISQVYKSSGFKDDEVEPYFKRVQQLRSNAFDDTCDKTVAINGRTANLHDVLEKTFRQAWGDSYFGLGIYTLQARQLVNELGKHNESRLDVNELFKKGPEVDKHLKRKIRINFYLEATKGIASDPLKMTDDQLVNATVEAIVSKQFPGLKDVDKAAKEKELKIQLLKDIIGSAELLSEVVLQAKLQALGFITDNDVKSAAETLFSSSLESKRTTAAGDKIPQGSKTARTFGELDSLYRTKLMDKVRELFTRINILVSQGYFC
ncbi:MAG: hypothetical protein AABZ57_06030, partial [Candidatus Margulisiibacteriota bacterium]